MIQQFEGMAWSLLQNLGSVALRMKEKQQRYIDPNVAWLNFRTQESQFTIHVHQPSTISVKKL